MAENQGSDRGSDKGKGSNGGFNPNAHVAADLSEEASGELSKESSKLEEYKALSEKHHNDFLYLRADFDNYKKNAIKERADYLKYGSERLIVEMLGVLDNFERALEIKATPENMATFVKGVEMTAQELRSVLQKFGVSEIPAAGKAFDPNLHEALGAEESKDLEPGHVLRVFKKPYKLHDKVIRPGQVVVAKSAGH